MNNNAVVSSSWAGPMATSRRVSVPSSDTFWLRDIELISSLIIVLAVFINTSSVIAASYANGVVVDIDGNTYTTGSTTVNLDGQPISEYQWNTPIWIQYTSNVW
jgi:hypothetical protein